MKDYLGNELEIGDHVVGVLPGYREFVKGVIYAFTPQKVRIEYFYNFYGQGMSSKKILQDPAQLIAIDKVNK